MTRCPYCDAPAVVRHDRVTIAHLSWCRHSPRPTTPRPDPTPRPQPQPIEPDPDQTIRELTERANALRPGYVEQRAESSRATYAAMRHRLDQLGATNTDVRRWAYANGLTDTARGVASRELIEAYARAHHEQQP